MKYCGNCLAYSKIKKEAQDGFRAGQETENPAGLCSCIHEKGDADMENMENKWNAGGQGDNPVSENGGAAQSAGGQQSGNGWSGDSQNTGYQNGDSQNTVQQSTGYQNSGYQNGNYQNAGYQNGSYQNADFQNAGYQNGGYQNNGYQNQPYQNASYQSESPYQGAPLRPDGHMEGPEEPISVGEWLVTMLVLAIPCVNLVMLLVWGFGSTEKRTKANFCKASLIWSGIMAALIFILYVVVLAGVLSAL